MDPPYNIALEAAKICRRSAPVPLRPFCFAGGPAGKLFTPQRGVNPTNKMRKIIHLFPLLILGCGPYFFRSNSYKQTDNSNIKINDSLSVSLKLEPSCGMKSFLFVVWWDNCKEPYYARIKVESNSKNIKTDNVEFHSVKIIPDSSNEIQLVEKDMPFQSIPFSNCEGDKLCSEISFNIDNKFKFVDGGRVKIKVILKTTGINKELEFEKEFVGHKEKDTSFMFYQI